MYLFSQMGLKLKDMKMGYHTRQEKRNVGEGCLYKLGCLYVYGARELSVKRETWQSIYSSEVCSNVIKMVLYFAKGAEGDRYIYIYINIMGIASASFDVIWQCIQGTMAHKYWWCKSSRHVVPGITS